MQAANQPALKLRRTCMNDFVDSGFVGYKSADDSGAVLSLLALPTEVLETVLRFCDDAETLANIKLTCSSLRGSFDVASGLRLVDKTARAAVLAAAGPEHAGRWRRRSWLSRLNIEDSGVGFANFVWSPPQAQAGAQPVYRFMQPTTPDSFLHIKLDGMGPKLLVSDLSTADQPILRWRLVVRGNTAVEFGIVPLCLEEDDKALHKCQQDSSKFERLKGKTLPDEQRPTGFCSSITVGSLLPFKTAIMKGSVVELLARRGRLEILVQNPLDGQELYWHNTRTVPKPYKGPREVRFEQDFSPDFDIKLALTSWAHGAFDVLHPAPGSRVLGGSHQQAWERLGRRHSSSDSSTDAPASPDGNGQQSAPPAEQPLEQPGEQQQAEQQQEDIVVDLTLEQLQQVHVPGVHIAGTAAHAVQEAEAALQAQQAAFMQAHQQAPAQQQQPAAAAQQQQQAPGSPSDTSSQEVMEG